MKLNQGRVILFIEPQKTEVEPLVEDDITRFIEKELNEVMKEEQYSKNHGSVDCNGVFHCGMATRGVHTCACGAKSTNQDYLLFGCLATNSLAVHYLKYHRSEVSDEEIEKIEHHMKAKMGSKKYCKKALSKAEQEMENIRHRIEVVKAKIKMFEEEEAERENKRMKIED